MHNYVEFSPDGQFLLTGGVDKSVRLWDVASGSELREFLGHEDAVTSFRFSPDGRYFVSTSLDQTARLWDTQTGQELQRFSGHSDGLLDAAFSPDGRTIVTGSMDKTARLWDAQTGEELRTFIGHTNALGPPAFSPSGTFVATSSADRTLRLWDVAPESEPQRFAFSSSDHLALVQDVTLTNDGQLAAVATQNAIRLWDHQTMALQHEIAINTATVQEQAFTTDGQQLLVALSDGLVRIWDTASGTHSGELQGHSGTIWALALAADGRSVLTGGSDGTARLWDLASRQELRRLDHLGVPVLAVALAPDGQSALTGTEDGVVRLWDTQTGQELRQFPGHTGAIRAIAVAPDGRSGISAGDDGTARLWNLADGRALRTLFGHAAAVTHASFAPDGRSVLTGSVDETTRLWDSASGVLLRQLGGHGSPVRYATLSADGQAIYTADTRAVYIWRTSMEEVISYACEQLGQDLSAEERARYEITSDEPTCERFNSRTLLAEAAWTAVPPGAIAVQPLSFAASSPPADGTVEMSFLSDISLIESGIPVQDVYVEADADSVARPTTATSATLAMPLYSAATEVSLDMAVPYELGPFPKGAPLGFILADWIAARGSGTYTAHKGRAVLEMTFDDLVPNGVYTVWCVVWSLNTFTVGYEGLCPGSDDTVNAFTADASGHGSIRMGIDALPASTKDAIQEIAIAYHSDGQTHGAIVGQHGQNAHAQLVFDFLPPDL